MLYLLLSVFLLGFFVLEMFTYVEAKKTVVRGPAYNQILQSADLIADILPPPEYIVETYLNILQLSRETDSKKIDLLLSNLKRLEKEYYERHEYWIKDLPDGDLKNSLIIDSYKPADELYKILNQDFLPAILAKNYKLTDELANGKLKNLYDEHRLKINSVVEKASARHENDENHADQIIKNTTLLLTVGIVIFLMTFIIIFWAIFKAVAKNQLIINQALAEAQKSYSMIQHSPTPTMMCDTNGILTFLNPASSVILKKLESHLPKKVDNLIGKSIDIFHKNPAFPKKIISNPANLPHKAIISIGPEKAELMISAVMNPEGIYIGATVAWSVVTARVNMMNSLNQAANHLTDAATNVLSISSNLSASSEETSAQANTASVASEEVNTGVQTVASNMGEMVSAIKEITKTTNEAAAMTTEAMRLTKNTNTIINKLGESSMDIGNVIKVISSIAQQTNLLALNATIEAARVGEAGKGFAVVANEVKELANQTSIATSEITKKIETIQLDSKNAVEAIAEITIAIDKVNGFTSNIAASVEEQAATTNEVTRIVLESAEGVKQINENISQVSQASAMTGKDANNAQGAAKGVGETAEQLKKIVADMMSN